MSYLRFILLKTNRKELFTRKIRVTCTLTNHGINSALLKKIVDNHIKSSSCSLSEKFSTVLKPQPRAFIKKKTSKNRFETKPHYELLRVLEKHHRTLKSRLKSQVCAATNHLEPDAIQRDGASNTNEILYEVLYDSPEGKAETAEEPVLDFDELRHENFELSATPESLFRDLESAEHLVEIQASATKEEDVESNEDIFPPAANRKRSTSKQLLKEIKKTMTAKEQEELIKKSKEDQLNFSLKSYIDVCINADLLTKAVHALKYYTQHKPAKMSPQINDVGVYNLLLHGLAGKGSLMQLRSVFDIMRKEMVKPNLQSYAAYLECLARQETFDMQEGNKVLGIIAAENLKLENIYRTCQFLGDQQKKVFEAVETLVKDFQPNAVTYPKGYLCNLLSSLNGYKKNKFYCPMKGMMDLEQLTDLSRQQMRFEKIGNVAVKSVVKPQLSFTDLQLAREKLSACENEWRDVVTSSFTQSLHILKNSSHVQKSMNIYPYLAVLDTDCYVNIVLQEIRAIAEASESFSLSFNDLRRNVGVKVMERFIASVKQKHGFAKKIESLYCKYLIYQTDHKLHSTRNQREYWQHLISSHLEGPSVNYRFIRWPSDVLLEVGRFLYNVLLRNIRIDSNTFRKNCKSTNFVPAFYSVFRYYKFIPKEEIKPHPILAKLYRDAAPEHMNFEVSVVPMLSPPLPWISLHHGGFLLSETSLVRLMPDAHQHQKMLARTPNQQLYPSFDSLNVLAECPWIVNKPILDIMIDMFNNGGNKDLEIPHPPSSILLPPLLPTMTAHEKCKVLRERAIAKRKKAEMYSLWCDTLYKLSIANHFRDRVFWFPHNMDFRGRVYPTPPHFNHLGSDRVRSLLLFAKGERLGKNGLDWLKIHLINLTGLKKRDSVEERLKYANEMLPEILDSADFPLTGRKWWQKVDKPWQSLACCKEIASAIRSPDPKNYVCHFHVHQDGSCNGLQHYAALGLDQHGAVEVNLHPSHLPQDVYSGVAALVERERAKDAAAGHQIAQSLEGRIQRKVIKQTVMTIVYGVTRYGARYQILKQLKDLDGFPEQNMWRAAAYLTDKTFLSILEMFTAAKQIQNWFTDCASLVTKVARQPVEWVTPLGFPVVQPYYKTSNMSSSYFRKTGNYSPKINRICCGYPDTVKQKNAFPPNFVHSLDSSHMMLTSIFCQRKHITFMSVHDCYWTHPSHVEILNKICRKQFVALHSEPILENLSKYFVEKYGLPKSVLEKSTESHQLLELLNSTLTNIPEKGSFKLEKVLESQYFFS